jgi:FkbM family methyltransferase
MIHPGASTTSTIWEQDRLGVARALVTIRDTTSRILHHPANRGRRGRALALYLLWQVWQRLVRLPWTIRLGETRRIRLYPHSVVAAFVLYYRIHDFEEMSFIRAYLRRGDLFVDVGANIAVYSLWASETEGVDVLAFEPSSVTHGRALENVELNGLTDRIRVVRKAVGSKGGLVRLTTGLDAVNQVIDGDETDSEAVEQTTLDHELGHRVPAIVKVDVEGKELEVLRGGQETISRHRPALIIEVNDVEGLTNVLADMDYQSWSYDPKTGGLAPTVPVLHTNVIALADIDDARARLHS